MSLQKAMAAMGDAEGSVSKPDDENMKTPSQDYWMPEDLLKVPDKMPTIETSSVFRHDELSQTLLDKYTEIKDKKPVVITNDSDGIFNAVSMALYGNELFSSELRIRCLIEMTKNAKIYKCHPDAKSFLLFSSPYEAAVANCERLEKCLSVWVFLALSTVIGIDINSVYPPVAGQDMASTFLNRCFQPLYRLPDNASSITIMWTTTGEVHPPAWSPNHFVPLIVMREADKTAPVTTTQEVILAENISQDTTPEGATQIVPEENATDVVPVDNANIEINTEETSQIISGNTLSDGQLIFVVVEDDINTAQTTEVVECADILQQTSGSLEVCNNIEVTGTGEIVDSNSCNLITTESGEWNTSCVNSSDLPPVTMEEKVTTTEAESNIDCLSLHSYHTVDSKPQTSMESPVVHTTESDIQLEETVVPSSNRSMDAADLKKECSSDFDSYREDSEDEGQGDMARDNSRLTIQEIFDEITQAKEVLSHIPPGTKNNVFMLIDNTSNIIRSKNNMRIEFPDDCGLWDITKTSISTAQFIIDGTLKQISKKAGAYSVLKKDKYSNSTWIPLERQPDEESIIAMDRYSSCLKANSAYKKRVTWFSKLPPQHKDKLPVALVEYNGILETENVHTDFKQLEAESLHIKSKQSRLASLQSEQQMTNQMENSAKNVKSLTVRFTAQEIFHEITNATDVLPSVPAGTKNNVYMIVDNSDNVMRRRKNMKLRFDDDCGTWDNSSINTVKSEYVISDGMLKMISQKDGLYCFQCAEKRKGKQSSNWVPLEPQPTSKEKVVLQKYYACLKSNENFKKRVSWFSKLPPQYQKELSYALVEYSSEIDDESLLKNEPKSFTDGVSERPSHVYPLINRLSAEDIYYKVINSKGILSEIPPGDKRNVYMLIDDSQNVTRREKKMRFSYPDDCGTWNINSRTIARSDFLISEGSLKTLHKKNDVFCVEKRVKGRSSWVPLDPQPKEEDLVTLHRYYTSLKSDDNFKKRVSWFSKLPPEYSDKTNIALIEYSLSQDIDTVNTEEQSDLELSNSPPHISQVTEIEEEVASNVHDLKDRFTAEEIYKEITNASEVLSHIPTGIKNNVYMLIDNTDNILRRENKQKSEFPDDCGAWDSNQGTTVKTEFLLSNDTLKPLHQKNGVYCVEKQKNKRVSWVPSDPQPDENDIVALHRYYTCLKADNQYKKRVSWFSKLPMEHRDKLVVALVEYRGIYPVQKQPVKKYVRKYDRTRPQNKKCRGLYLKLLEGDSLNESRKLSGLLSSSKTDSKKTVQSKEKSSIYSDDSNSEYSSDQNDSDDDECDDEDDDNEDNDIDNSDDTSQSESSSEDESDSENENNISSKNKKRRLSTSAGPSKKKLRIALKDSKSKSKAKRKRKNSRRDDSDSEFDSDSDQAGKSSKKSKSSRKKKFKKDKDTNNRLSVQEIYEKVTQATEVFSHIPHGEKSDSCFLIDNTHNVARKQKKLKTHFPDDCGTWDSRQVKTVSTTHTVSYDILKKVFLKDSMYCDEKRVDKQFIVSPLKPQPSENDIVVLHRYYACLKNDKNFKKRVSWFSKLPPEHREKLTVALVEYSGDWSPDGSDELPSTTLVEETPYAFARSDTMEKASNVKDLESRLSVQEVYDEITKAKEVLSHIPPGEKNNVYMLIDNRRNVAKRRKNMKSDFPDDCGIWDSKRGSTAASILVLIEGALKSVIRKKRVYGVNKQVERRTTWVALDPQPDKNEIVVLHRYYTCLKADNSYQKRVSWFSKLPREHADKLNIALVEYTGFRVTESVHGNAKKNLSPYIRTRPEVLDKAASLGQNKKPREVYLELTENEHVNAPLSLSQIRNKRYHDRKKLQHTVTSAVMWESTY